MKLKNIFLFAGIVTLLKIVFVFFVHDIRGFEDHEISINLLYSGEMFYRIDGNMNHSLHLPAYPFLLFVLYKIFGIVPQVALVMNVLFNGTAAILFNFVTKNILDEAKVFSDVTNNKICFVSLVIFLLHPAINYYALFNVHSFSLDLLLLMLSVYLAQKLIREQNKRSLILFSLSIALTLLDRPTLAVVFFSFALSAVLIYKLQKGIQFTLLAFLLSVVFISPWLIRNYRTEKIIGLSSETGKLLWKGILHESEGSNYLESGSYYFSVIPEQQMDSLRKMSVRQQQDFFMTNFFAAVKSNPTSAVKMFFMKLKNFWFFRNRIGNELPASLEPFIILYKIIYLIILALAVGAVFIFRKPVFLLASVPVLLSLLQSVFYVETRHRIIIEPFLIFMAVCLLFYLSKKFTSDENIIT